MVTTARPTRRPRPICWPGDAVLGQLVHHLAGQDGVEELVDPASRCPPAAGSPRPPPSRRRRPRPTSAAAHRGTSSGPARWERPRPAGAGGHRATASGTIRTASRSGTARVGASSAEAMERSFHLVACRSPRGTWSRPRAPDGSPDCSYGARSARAAWPRRRRRGHAAGLTAASGVTVVHPGRRVRVRGGRTTVRSIRRGAGIARGAPGTSAAGSGAASSGQPASPARPNSATASAGPVVNLGA